MSTTALVRSKSSTSSVSASPAALQSRPSLPAAHSTPGVSIANTTPQKTPTATTPRSQKDSPGPSTPTQWRHPRMDEVIRRQSRTTFDSRNVKAILWNAGFLITSLALPRATGKITPEPHPSLRPWTTSLLLALTLFFTANILLSLSPLFRTRDACEDIPLTPHQRRLLGLPPMTRPATPQEQAQYATPPRYPRTPQSATSSLRVHASASPGASATPSSAVGSGSTAVSSPGYASLLHQQQQSPLAGPRNRQSFGSARSSPLGASEVESTGAGGAAGHSPANKLGGRASVGLNSKWLYEKGRASPGAKSNNNGWGTGSVFN